MSRYEAILQAIFDYMREQKMDPDEWHRVTLIVRSAGHVVLSDGHEFVRLQDGKVVQGHYSPGCISLFEEHVQTLRDWFAGMALAEVPDPQSEADAPKTAKLAYAIADAMLAERRRLRMGGS